MRFVQSTLLVVALGVGVSAQGQEFAADWVRADTASVVNLARLLRSGDRLRIETRAEAKPQIGAAPASLVVIGERASGTGWRVDEQGQALARQRLPASLVTPWPLLAPAQQRCQDPALRCQALFDGSQDRDGLSVWQIHQYRQDGWQTTMLWQQASGEVVREQWLDGRSVQLLEAGIRPHEGRDTEFRHYVITDRNGTRWHSRYWYDSSLAQVLREDQPDGSSRWLQNIETGSQAEAAFAVRPPAPPPGPPSPVDAPATLPGQDSAASGFGVASRPGAATEQQQ